jgi:hypothetical protein
MLQYMFEVISPITQGGTCEEQGDCLPTEDFARAMSPFDINSFQDISNELHGDQVVDFDDTWLQSYQWNSRGISRLDSTLAYTEEGAA